jgi:hypothetical protein
VVDEIAGRADRGEPSGSEEHDGRRGHEVSPG